MDRRRDVRMVRNAKNMIDLTKASVSFIPSLKCNNKCSFCMYQSGPDMDIRLSLDDAKHFVETVDWDKICGWGLYGGEPSIELDWYQQFYELLPSDVPKFTITNGSWTQSCHEFTKFLTWCLDKPDLSVHISSCTDEHRANQNMKVIEYMPYFPRAYVRTKEEELHPMGRNFKGVVSCTEKCIWHKQPVRLGIFPTGDVLLQNCDGAYPVVSHISEGFAAAFDAAVRVREKGLCKCKQLSNINDVLERKVDAYNKG